MGNLIKIKQRKVGLWKLDTVHNVDCLDGLKRMPDDSLDTAITSPHIGVKGVMVK